MNDKDGETTMSRSKNILLGAAALVAMTTAAGAAPIRIGMTFQELNNPYFVTMQKALRRPPPRSAPPSSSPTRITT